MNNSENVACGITSSDQRHDSDGVDDPRDVGGLDESWWTSFLGDNVGGEGGDEEEGESSPSGDDGETRNCGEEERREGKQNEDSDQENSALGDNQRNQLVGSGVEKDDSEESCGNQEAKGKVHEDGYSWHRGGEYSSSYERDQSFQNIHENLRGDFFVQLFAVEDESAVEQDQETGSWEEHLDAS